MFSDYAGIRLSVAPATVGNIGGLGTGVATALAINVGSAGSFVVNGGALGSPSSVGSLPAFTASGGMLTTGTVLSRFENSASSLPAGSAGSGIEVIGSSGLIQAYDRTGGAFVDATLKGLTVTLNANGSVVAVANTGALVVTGYVSASTRFNLPSFTVLTLPDAALAGGMIYVSDAGGNGPCMAVTNGTNWKRCDNTGTTVS